MARFQTVEEERGINRSKTRKGKAKGVTKERLRARTSIPNTVLLKVWHNFVFGFLENEEGKGKTQKEFVLQIT